MSYSDSGNTTSSASTTTHEAQEAMNRMLNRHLTSARTIGIAYDHRHTTVDARHEDGFDTLSDINDDLEAGKPDFHTSHAQKSDPRQHLLRHTPPPFHGNDSPGSSSPESYSSSDMPELFYSPRRMRERRELAGQTRWWEIDFDEWNACLGAYLIGCIIVIVVGAVVVGIWILLHR
jgi:hypothetical protein